MAGSPFTKTAALVAGNLAVFTLLAGLLEGGARLFFPRHIDALFSDGNLRITGRPFVEAHPKRGFALKPGFENELYRINQNGFRGPELPATLEDRTVIVALGESTTFGWEVPEGDDYPHHLQRILNRNPLRKPAYVVNAGVPSYSSSQVRLYLEEVLERLDPDLILISVLWNDVWFSTLRNWYPEVLVFQQPARWQQLMLRHSGLYRALVLRRPPDRDLVDVFNAAAFAHYGSNIEAMIDLCAGRGVPLVFVSPPLDPDHVPEEGIDPFNDVRLTKPFFIEISKRYLARLAELGARRGVPVIDHRLALGKPPAPQLFIDLLHPVGEGNARIAEDVARELLAEGRVFRARFPPED